MLWVDARWAFVASAFESLGRSRTSIRVPKELGMGAFQYRSVGKFEYITRLAAFDKMVIVSMEDLTDVDDSALCFTKPRLSKDFRII